MNLLKTAKKLLGRRKAMLGGKKSGLRYHSLYKCFHILLYFKHIVGLNELENIRHMRHRFLLF